MDVCWKSHNLKQTTDTRVKTASSLFYDTESSDDDCCLSSVPRSSVLSPRTSQEQERCCVCVSVRTPQASLNEALLCSAARNFKTSLRCIYCHAVFIVWVLSIYQLICRGRFNSAVW
ncbi:uncharacterized protein LOC110828717 [Zootermopsis nevadensis]|uniref:uncharacterized protein LOC110828717 n=1 Tax=Zootermopsis nevadensis TaxID=136037 RepID=UPI000B8E30A4|nr:uncharacterized protein LOC110828717 [Zootermopsis nevadensis]